MLMRILHIGICSLLLISNVQALDSLDILPETDSQQSTAVLNNTLRQQQNAINAVGSYFNSSGYLEVTSGGTSASGLTGIIQGNGTSPMTAIAIPADATKFLDGTGTFSALPADVNTSNVLFQYSGDVDDQGTSLGEVIGSTLTPNSVAGNYRFLQTFDASGDAYHTIWTSKFKKFSGVSTITVYARFWQRTISQATIKVDVGGQNGSVSGTASQTTPEWKSFSIDVSGLTNGNVYDVTASLKVTAGNVQGYCSNIIGFGS